MSKEKRNAVVQIIIAFMGCMVGLLALLYFNNYLLMSFNLVLRMILMIITYWLIAIVPLIIGLVKHDKPSDYGFTGKKIGNQILIGTAIALVMSFLFTLIPIFLGYGNWVNSGKTYQYLWQFVYEFIFCILGVSLAEEFVFRGFLYHKIQQLFHTELPVILISSAMFGLFHILSGGIIQVIGTMIIGIIFCLCRYKIKNCSLLSLIIAHGVYDALITVWGNVLVSGFH